MMMSTLLGSDKDIDPQESMEVDSLSYTSDSQVDIQLQDEKEECISPSISPVPKRFKQEDIMFCPECAKKDKRTEIVLNQLQNNEYVMMCPGLKCKFTKYGVGIPKTCDDVTVPPLEPKRFTWDEIGFCPWCVKKKKRSVLSASQLNNNEYALICDDANCFFIQTGIGIVPLSKAELIACGYPEELMLHMDVYEDDLYKITRLCIYQYLEKRTCASSRNIDRDLIEINEEIEVLRFLHGINPKDTSVNFNSLKQVSLLKELKKDLKLTVVGLSRDFKEKVISAFSKIENFKFPESLIVSLKNSRVPTEVPEDDFTSIDEYLRASTNSDKLKMDSDAKVEMTDELKELIDSYEDKVPLADDKGFDLRRIEEMERELGIDELIKKYDYLPSIESNAGKTAVKVLLADNGDYDLRRIEEMERELGIDELIKKYDYLPSIESNAGKTAVIDKENYQSSLITCDMEREVGIEELLNRFNIV